MPLGGDQDTRADLDRPCGADTAAAAPPPFAPFLEIVPLSSVGALGGFRLLLPPPASAPAAPGPLASSALAPPAPPRCAPAPTPARTAAATPGAPSRRRTPAPPPACATCTAPAPPPSPSAPATP